MENDESRNHMNSCSQVEITFYQVFCFYSHFYDGCYFVARWYHCLSQELLFAPHRPAQNKNAITQRKPIRGSAQNAIHFV